MWMLSYNLYVGRHECEVVQGARWRVSERIYMCVVFKTINQVKIL